MRVGVFSGAVLLLIVAILVLRLAKTLQGMTNRKAGLKSDEEDDDDDYLKEEEEEEEDDADDGE